MRKVVDLVDNRVDMNLRAICSTMLVDLPSDKSFTYDEFMQTQVGQGGEDDDEGGGEGQG